MKKKVFICVINDLVTDQRIHKLCGTLKNSNAELTVIGRQFPHSSSPDIPKASIVRFRLLVNRGFLFYAFYNFRLFIFLLFRKRVNVIVSNDLDTLPACFLVSKLRKGSVLIYDSHEYFTEVPELNGRKFVKVFWKLLESWLVPNVDLAYTVNSTLAKMYSAKYGVEFRVIRNVPEKNARKEEYPLPVEIQKNKLVIYQGAVNKDRGLEEMIDAIREFEDVTLIIAGSGDILNELKRIVFSEGLDDKVYFTGRIIPSMLRSLTGKAQLGVSLERKTSLNYYYALPNKIFDYIHAGIPVLCSSFPEMRNVVEGSEVGMTIEPGNRDLLIDSLRKCLFDEELRKKWQGMTVKASEELCWENEQKKIREIYSLAGIVF